MSENNKVLLSIQDLKEHFPLKKKSVFQKEVLHVKEIGRAHV